VEESQIANDWQALARREDILDVLQVRFPGELPASILARIETRDDATILKRWHNLALTAASLEQFEADLQP
jgi:hypothetical protein